MKLFSGSFPQRALTRLEPTSTPPQTKVKNIDASLNRILNPTPKTQDDNEDKMDSRFGVEDDEDNDDDDDTSNLGLSLIDEASRTSTFPAPAVKNLAIYYLQKELKLSEETLMNVILKYSWVMYLKVETNLKPTVEVLRSFGFKEHHIRTIVSIVPSVLAINHNWTLPEKLLSIQKMFYLTRAQLVRLCCEQPLLLTSSIDRNMAVSEFLSDQRTGMGLSPEQVRTLLSVSPKVAMTGIGVLKVCWNVLTETYGLSPKEARSLVMKCPPLISQQLLKKGLDRLNFFSQDLGLPVPESEARHLVMRFPALLYLDTDVFLRPNLAVLRESLELTNPELVKILSIFPQLLGCNPTSLHRQCSDALWLLTGQAVYQPDAKSDDGDIQNELLYEDEDVDGEEEGRVEGGGIGTYFYTRDDDTRDTKTISKSLQEVVAELSVGKDQLDLIGDIVRDTDQTVLTHLQTKIKAASADAASVVVTPQPNGIVSRRRLIRALENNPSNAPKPTAISPAEPQAETSSSGLMRSPASNLAMEIEATRLMLQACDTLVLDRDRALKVTAEAPWILSYRPERSKRVLASLAVSLGMSRQELSRCVSLYPRLLSFSVDMKITSVLRSLTTAAAKIYAGSMLEDEKTASEESRGALSMRSMRLCHDAKSLSASAQGEASLADDIEATIAMERRGVTLYNVADYEEGLEIVYRRRRNTIRSMVRSAVLRYPLILGTSMGRIDSRLSLLQEDTLQLAWPQVISLIRRNDAAHARWLGKLNLNHVLEKPPKKPPSKRAGGKATSTAAENKKKP